METKKLFRINSKKLLLTYPKCDLEKEHVLDLLKNKVQGVEEYAICREQHKDGSNHIHAYLKLSKNIDTINPRFFDIEEYHGRYEGVRNKNATINYIVKQSDYISNLLIIEGVWYMPKQYMIKLTRLGRLEEALNYLYEKCEDSTSFQIISFEKNLRKIHNRLYPNKVIPAFKYDDYDYPADIKDWFESNENRSLVIEGPSGLGKTQGSLAYAEHKGLNVLFIQLIEGLKRLSPKHNLILADDLDFSSMSAEQYKAFLDSRVPAEINVKHGSVMINQGVKRIITCNNWNPKGTERDLLAIKNRAKVVNVDKSLIRQTKIKLELEINEFDNKSN